MFFSERTGLQKLLLLKAAAGGSVVEDTATGNPLTFLTDLAKPLKSLVANFLPVQTGSGDPSPENVRPITGWDAVNVFHTGKNLLNPNIGDWSMRLTTYYYINGVVPEGATARLTLEVKDESVDISGCYLGFVYENLAESAPTNYRWVIENGTVKSDMSNLSQGSAQFQRRCSNVFIYPATAEVFQKIFSHFNVMVELGQTATAYEAYQTPSEYSTTFPSTIYGGYVDLVTWEVWQTHKRVELNSIRDILTASGGTVKLWRITLAQKGIVTSYSNRGNYYAEEYVSSNDAVNGHIYITGDGTTCIVVPYEGQQSITTKTDADAWLAENPVVYVYPLAVPVLITTLTPQQITAIKGNNTIWSDANGEMTAIYYKKG